MKNIILGFLLFIFLINVKAEDQVLSALFKQNKIEGTLLISSLNGNVNFIHNKSRSKQEFSPASTFKILNTLILLEENIINDQDFLFKWNGEIYNREDLNHDQTLDQAFKISCLWCYQHASEKLDFNQYQKYLKKSNYGNIKHPFKKDLFWINDSLQISAIEQIKFLKKVYHRQLPFKQEHYLTLEKLMLIEENDHFKLRAKTGWTGQPQKVGWYVGYIETPKNVWFFAMNMKIDHESQLSLRQKITKSALELKGIIQTNKNLPK